MRQIIPAPAGFRQGSKAILLAMAAQGVRTAGLLAILLIVLAAQFGGVKTGQPSSPRIAAADTMLAAATGQTAQLDDVVLAGHYDKGRRFLRPGGCDFGQTTCYVYEKVRGT